jgi:hypothetical protein
MSWRRCFARSGMMRRVRSRCRRAMLTMGAWLSVFPSQVTRGCSLSQKRGLFASTPKFRFGSPTRGCICGVPSTTTANRRGGPAHTCDHLCEGMRRSFRLALRGLLSARPRHFRQGSANARSPAFEDTRAETRRPSAFNAGMARAAIFLCRSPTAAPGRSARRSGKR